MLKEQAWKLRAAVAGRRPDGRIVDPVTGRQMDATEGERVRLALEHVLAQSAVPAGVSAEIPCAPGRGMAQPWLEPIVEMTGSGPRVRSGCSAQGRALRIGSPLERLEASSRSRSRRAGFTVAQHQAAATYEALHERVHGGHVKCVSLDGGTGGGRADGVMDAIIGDIRRLRAMNRAIGVGIVLDPTGAAAQPGRRAVRAFDLVHAVVIEGLTLVSVLDRWGWSRQTRYIERLRRALAEALDRIHGF